MFPKEVYIDRRTQLKELMNSGLVLFLGNNEAPMNYSANGYHFRQDSNYLYFFGLDHDNLAGVVDVDNNIDIIFGNDLSIDDIIWMGPQPTMKERAAEAGIEKTLPMDKLAEFLQGEIAKGRKVHFAPMYRGEHFLQISRLLGIRWGSVDNYVSEELIRAIVKLRSIKDKYEIAEIEKAVDIAYEMHTTAMRMAKPGVVEREIAGTIEGISLAKGGPVSFPIILSIHGETLHNHYHGNTLAEGRMMVCDAGAETPMHYASDITRTTPVGGKFNSRQKDIYEIVLRANEECIKSCKPGIPNREIHLQAANILASGLRDLGLMKGDVAEAVRQGAHALFMPHGLGHMMGLDVHDMEGLGENYVGYDTKTQRSQQFGTAFLRLGRELESGFVLTVEPGCYFIPALIDQWKAEGKFTGFINYDKLEEYKDFGGIRIEDDVLVTDTAYKVLGKPIPKTVDEVEEAAAK
ncbi:MAG: aminopeptidase P family protein [Bacteroidota bacterium]|nr:aminopeptidase P family protein [Bacteroidota bacterium]